MAAGKTKEDLVGAEQEADHWQERSDQAEAAPLREYHYHALRAEELREFLHERGVRVIEPRQVIERARKLYSDIRARSKTTHWKAARMKGRVLWPGVPVPYSSDEFAAWLLDKVGCQAFLCPYCNAPLDALSMQLDHDIPLKAGGTNELSNLVPCCADCNNLKGKMTGADYLLFRKLLRQMHPAAEANILARLRAGALGQRLLFQQQAAKGRQRKSSPVPGDEPF